MSDVADYVVGARVPVPAEGHQIIELTWEPLAAAYVRLGELRAKYLGDEIPKKKYRPAEAQLRVEIDALLHEYRTAVCRVGFGLKLKMGFGSGVSWHFDREAGVFVRTA